MTSSKPGWDYSNTHRLFVYGTLMDPDLFVRRAGERFSVIPDGQEPPRNGLFAIRAAMGGCEKWKPRERNPEATRRPGDTIDGLLIFRLTGPMLKMLDEYEGGQYTRRSVDVTSYAGPMEAECYLALRDIPPRD